MVDKKNDKVKFDNILRQMKNIYRYYMNVQD